MKSNGRLCLTDISLGFCSKGTMILHPKHIKQIDTQSDEISELAANCNIYIIATRPRIFFDPASISIDKDILSGRLLYRIKGKESKCDFQIDVNLFSNHSIQVNEYPHNLLQVTSESGELISSLPAHLVPQVARLNIPEISDLKVVYVGMSYADGKRSAKDRLVSHSTLQAVMAETSSDQPDDEVLLLLVEYDSPLVFIVFNGRDKSLKIEDDRDIMADLERSEQFISKDLQISLTEAGLIKYFQPKYNEKYKIRFPNPKHEILEEVYNIDFGALSVEINTEDLSCRLYSELRKPGAHHIAKFDLFTPEKRRSFYNVMNIPDGPNADSMSGPIF